MDNNNNEDTKKENDVEDEDQQPPSSPSNDHNNNNNGSSTKKDEDNDKNISTTATSTSTTSSSTSENNNNNTTSSSNSSSTSSSSSSSGNLFVNFLPSTITTETLHAMFSVFGSIESCRVMVDLSTGLSRGFGFVKYRDNASAQYAIQSMNGAKIEKKTLLVRYANSEQSSSSSSSSPYQQQSNFQSSDIDHQRPSNNIYIKGLPITFTQDQLNSFFSSYGTVLESKILLDIATNSSRGQALVRFSDVESATKAIRALDNFKFPGADKQVIIKYADSEDDKMLKRQKATSKRPIRYSPYPSPTATPLYSSAAYYSQMAMPNLPAIQSPVLATGSDPTNLYVYNLPTDADDALLYRLFSPSGAIASVKVVKDPITQACRGFGFVRMVNLADSVNAINSVNGSIVEGKMLQVSFKR